MLNNQVFFGTAGIPHSAGKGGNAEGIREISRLSLDAMEIEFVRGVNMSEKTAKSLRIAAEESGVRLSCHCPYYINLNSDDPEKIKASKRRIVESAKILAYAGGHDVVFHAGYYGEAGKEQAILNIIDRMREIRYELEVLGISHMILRPELTGKESQAGSEQELAEMSSAVEKTLPCIDFSHYFARYTGEADFVKLFDFLEKEIPAVIGRMHSHLSGIEFTRKGEKKHLILSESVVPWREILDLADRYGMNGTIICESPNLEEDALMMKNYWQNGR